MTALSTTRRSLPHFVRQAQETSRLLSLGEVTAGAVHDLRSTLQSILIQVALARTSHAAPVRELVAIEEAVLELQKGFARLDTLAAPERPAMVPVDVAWALEDAVALARAARGSRRLSTAAEIAVEVEPGLPLVRATATALRQAFMHLVLLRLEALPGAMVRLSARRVAGAVEVVIRQDTAPEGAPPTVRARSARDRLRCAERSLKGIGATTGWRTAADGRADLVVRLPVEGH